MSHWRGRLRKILEHNFLELFAITFFDRHITINLNEHAEDRNNLYQNTGECLWWYSLRTEVSNRCNFFVELTNLTAGYSSSFFTCDSWKFFSLANYISSITRLICCRRLIHSPDHTQLTIIHKCKIHFNLNSMAGLPNFGSSIDMNIFWLQTRVESDFVRATEKAHSALR